MDKTTATKSLKDVINDSIEVLLVLALCGLIAVTYFSERRTTTFEFICVGVLVVWRFLVHYEPQRKLPKSLIICTVLYVVSAIIGALMSDDRHWELTELSRYVHLLIAGLLLTAPVSDKNRKILIVFFLICASLAGLVGILQFSGLLIKPDNLPPRGLSPHPILYAAILAFACGSAIVMIFIHNNALFQSKKEKAFLLVTIIVTFGGIISSESRGVWIALVLACTVTIYLYDHKKTLIFIFAILTIMAAIFIFNDSLRQRAASIVTSFYTENETGSTGNRLELWKGSLMIFRERPFLGTGTGNFEANIQRLISEKKLKEMPYTMHAHNIYLHVLVTRGIIGFIITIALFTTMVKFGIEETRERGGIGGYIIILCLVLTIVGGMTEINIELGKYLAALSLTIGLIGPYETYQVARKALKK